MKKRKEMDYIGNASTAWMNGWIKNETLAFDSFVHMYVYATTIMV